MNAKEISSRLRFWKIGALTDSAWIEEFTIGDGRLDLLTLDLKQWTVRGFEVKISRSDFLGDGKWQSYLPFVNYFYFATPPDLIKPEELPPEIGLVEIHEGKSVEKKKAKLLQSSFVRETYGERYMTRVLMKFLRDISWREERCFPYCECGKRVEFRDPRAAGHSVSRYGSSPVSL